MNISVKSNIKGRTGSSDSVLYHKIVTFAHMTEIDGAPDD